MTQSTLTPAAPIAQRGSRLLRFVVLGAVVLFVGGYALAWFSAMRLTQTYYADAEASFESGDYLNALTGYSEFVEEAGRNVFRGGYAQIVNIWSDRFAVPSPGEAEIARTRINTIINEHLTIEEAERFVQRNIGRGNPYIGPIYLRLGELYEAEGDLETAEEIYEDVIDSFRTNSVLLEQARSHLERLTQTEGEDEN